MGEQLKIDDPETIRLAAKLAESRSVSISELLRDLLERRDREATGEPLLFKGDDFARTDLVAAA